MVGGVKAITHSSTLKPFRSTVLSSCFTYTDSAAVQLRVCQPPGFYIALPSRYEMMLYKNELKR